METSLILAIIGLPMLIVIALYIHAKTKHKQGKNKGKDMRQKAREKKMKELFDYDSKVE